MSERDDWERWNGELALRCDALEARIERAKTILVEMDARDKRNGFLPIWWREKLDELNAALVGKPVLPGRSPRLTGGNSRKA